MSEFTEATLDRYLELDPETGAAYHHDPQVHADVERLREFIQAAERSLRDEGVPLDTARRVINRIVFGDPEARVSRYAEERARLAWSLAEASLHPAAEWQQFLRPSSQYTGSARAGGRDGT